LGTAHHSFLQEGDDVENGLAEGKSKEEMGLELLLTLERGYKV